MLDAQKGRQVPSLWFWIMKLLIPKDFDHPSGDRYGVAAFQLLIPSGRGQCWITTGLGGDTASARRQENDAQNKGDRRPLKLFQDSHAVTSIATKPLLVRRLRWLNVVNAPVTHAVLSEGGGRLHQFFITAPHGHQVVTLDEMAAVQVG